MEVGIKVGFSRTSRWFKAWVMAGSTPPDKTPGKRNLDGTWPCDHKKAFDPIEHAS